MKKRLVISVICAILLTTAMNAQISVSASETQNNEYTDEEYTGDDTFKDELTKQTNNNGNYDDNGTPFEKGGKDTLQVHLVRAVAKFAVKCTDAIPSGAATMEFSFQPGGSELNISTGLSADDPLLTYTRTITIPSANIGRQNALFSFYTFLPSESTTLYVKATCKDAEGGVLYMREFTDVPLSINHQTTYTGEFFRSGADLGGSFDVVSEWGEEQNFEF